MGKLVRMRSKLINDLCNDSNPRPHHLESTENYILAKIRELSTEYRRKQMCKSSPLYVAPIEKAIGLHFRSEFDKFQNRSHHYLQQSYFHYVPIIGSLKSLFLIDDFKTTYMDSGHSCTAGVYEKFCCGQLFEHSGFFRENPNAIRLRLAMDDFDICSPCKSKAVIHKITAIYCQIDNLPCHLQSRHENIFLVALCESRETKQRYTSLDNIIEHIVSEVKKLESEGIDVGIGEHLKGTLVSFTYDNLGGNALLGFVECFSADNWCRICLLRNEECGRTLKEISSSLRNRHDHEEILKQVEESEKNNVKGVKKYCLLDQLNYFDILDNKTVDMMHDVLEGVVPYLLSQLFKYLIDKKFLKTADLENRVRDHNYGALNADCLPSFIDLTKLKLNQNARQMYCLVLNVPFIFMDLKNKLEDIWICVQSLLTSMQIIFSQSINENDLLRLENCIATHLKSYMDVFETNLKPKHHLLTHYPSIIRKSGPVKNMWMMRFESKHKYFTDRAKKTNNFKNITKTLAIDHQQNMLNYENSFRDKFSHALEKQLTDTDLIYQITSNNLKKDNLVMINFLKFNGVEYRGGFIITQHGSFYEISYILKNIDNDEFLFVCISCVVEGFDEFSNSFRISKNNNTSANLKMISLQSLRNKRTYERVYYQNLVFIKAETLDLRKENYL